MSTIFRRLSLVGLLVVLYSPPVFAHFDTLDGPIVKDAILALQKRDVTPVLKWVAVDDEDGVRDLFDRVLAVRAGSKEAEELADLYFFETVVRLHRLAMGLPYFGLRPPGAIGSPAVTAADEAIKTGNVDLLAKATGLAVEAAIRKRFENVIETGKEKNSSLKEGRAFVEAYIDFTHFVDHIYRQLAEPAKPDIGKPTRMDIIIQLGAEGLTR